MDGGEGGFLRCYEDNIIGHVSYLQGNTPCDYITSTQVIHLQDAIYISPNPFADYIKINFLQPNVKELEVVIYSVEGSIIKHLNVVPNTGQLEIPLAELPAGYYILILTEQDAVKFITKLIKI